MTALLGPLPVPFVTTFEVLMDEISSRSVDLNGNGVWMKLLLESLSTKYVVECEDRALVGVGGMDWVEKRLGGV